MTETIIITFCSLVLLAYLFEVTASRTKIPAVILLLALGYLVRQGAGLLGFEMPDLEQVLPIIATLGLILIVLDGALEVEITPARFPLIKKSLFGAVLSIFVLAFFLAFLIHFVGGYSIPDSLINAIPLCVISSAIAIPSVKHLGREVREFVVYESSLSDIVGVILFNYMVFNTVYDFASIGVFWLEILLILIISALSTLGLAWLLGRINHSIKFLPIVMIIILLYEVLKLYHLPSLIFILIFGLFLGNLDELGNIKFIKKLRPKNLDSEVHRFKDLITEATFMIRSVFFIIFGYQIETADIIDTNSLGLALVISVTIYAFRVVQLALSNLPLKPLAFIAPRGLITILLFLSITPENRIGLIGSAIIVKIIIISALIMMFGMMIHNKKEAVVAEINTLKPDDVPAKQS
jgi:hypothetical protein